MAKASSYFNEEDEEGSESESVSETKEQSMSSEL